MVKRILPYRAIFAFRRAKVGAQRTRLVQVPSVPQFLDILHDVQFQSSVREVKHITKFDTARLANLWQLCRMADPQGTVLEVGVHRGGTALHMMNCRPGARFIFADTFRDVRVEEVLARLRRKARPGATPTVLVGNFPASDRQDCVRDIAFAHIDVVAYASCKAALAYVARRCRRSAIIVVNDVLRYPWGVTEALCEFTRAQSGWIVLPLYPGQAVALRRDAPCAFATLGRAAGIAERCARHGMPTFGTKADPLPF